MTNVLFSCYNIRERIVDIFSAYREYPVGGRIWRKMLNRSFYFVFIHGLTRYSFSSINFEWYRDLFASIRWGVFLYYFLGGNYEIITALYADSKRSAG